MLITILLKKEIILKVFGTFIFCYTPYGILCCKCQYWPSWACRGRQWRGDPPRGRARWQKSRRCAGKRRPPSGSTEWRPRPRRRPARVARWSGWRPTSRRRLRLRLHVSRGRLSTGGRVWRPSACARPPRWTEHRPARTERCAGHMTGRARRTSRTCWRLG